MAKEITRTTQEELDEIKAYLEAKWGGARPCPMCQHSSWDIPFQVALIPHSKRTTHLTGAVVPTIPLICNNCGYTILLNAVIAGLTKTDEDFAAEEEQADAE